MSRSIWNILEEPFDVEEHDWKDGQIYLRKDAIRRRLTEADPRWELSPPAIVNVHDDVVIMTASLIVAGISRAGIGTGVIQHAKIDPKTGEVNRTVEANLLAKAYKSAASDCLPRAALEFNVGWYLRHLSDQAKQWVKTREGLQKYLASLNKHWALNGGGRRFVEKMEALELNWPQVAAQLEQGIVLARLSDTSLSEAEAVARLEELAALIEK